MGCHCINPFCVERKNPELTEYCLSCGVPLIVKNRIRLIKPLREINIFDYFEVFEVEDRGKLRIMKILKWVSPKLNQLIEREALTLQILNHPCIPRSTEDDFFDISISSNSTKELTLRCLVMDKFPGENLEEWLRVHQRISQATALDWLQQVVKILDVVHHTEIFHRDIKPSNIIIQPNGQLALIDFGAVRPVTNTYMAKISSAGGTSTRSGTYEITSVVTPGYTPAEQINGQAVPQSDFFAIGRTFVNLVTGIPVLSIPTNKAGNLNWRSKAPQIEKPFADLLDELMSPLPGQRPQSTQIILQRLDKLPSKLKFNRIIRSKIFKLSITTVSVITLIVLTKTVSLFLSNYYFNLGFRNANNPQLSRKYYQLALKFNDQDTATYNNLALACQQLHDLPCVDNAYNKLFHLNPVTWEGHYGLGNFYADQGKYDLAQKEYKLAIRFGRERAINAFDGLSRLNNKQGNYTDAAIIANKGLKYTQDRQLRAALYKNLGWSSFGLKQYTEAKKYLQQAIELDAQRVDAFCLLAQVQEITGDLSGAKVSWEVCMIANSQLPEVSGWREQLLQRILK